MAERYMLVLSTCLPGRDDEYNEYYDNQPIPDGLRALPELVSGQRFKVEAEFAPEGVPKWQYSTLYKIDTDDFDAYSQRLHEALKKNLIPPSDAAEPSTAALFRLIPLGPPITR